MQWIVKNHKDHFPFKQRNEVKALHCHWQCVIWTWFKGSKKYSKTAKNASKGERETLRP